jgi:hypothetical protein
MAADAVLRQLEEMAASARTGSLRTSLSCSYMQIYNEKVYDLMMPTNQKPLIVRENLSSAPQQRPASGLSRPTTSVIRKVAATISATAPLWTTVVTGVTEHEVNSTEDLATILRKGVRNRITRATQQNEASSRSHTMIQFHVLVEEDKPGSEGASASMDGKQTTIRKAKLTLVDLAGSERCKCGKMNINSIH